MLGNSEFALDEIISAAVSPVIAQCNLF